jgi:hypothetical protein
MFRRLLKEIPALFYGADAFFIFWAANRFFLRFRFSNTLHVFCDTVLEKSGFRHKIF